MTVTLHLKPELEAVLTAQAQARQMRLEDYLVSRIEEAVFPAGEKTVLLETEKRADAVHRMLEFGKKYHLGLEESVGRALLHQDHRF